MSYTKYRSLGEYDLVVPDIVQQYPLCFKEHIFKEWPVGWHSLVENMLEELTKYIESKTEIPVNPFVILTIKEKFGAMRVYAAYQDEGHRVIIDKYYHLSTITCMYCSKEGTIEKTNGWLRCVCPKHSLAWKHVIIKESQYNGMYLSHRGKLPSAFHNLRDSIFVTFEKYYDDNTGTLNEEAFNNELSDMLKAEE